MLPTNIIDYSKFKIEVYSPDGQFIKDVPKNSINIFYCAGLIPGQEYTVLFIYDNILVLCVSFTSNNNGKVVYLDPSHFLYNNEISYLSFNANSDLAKKVKDLALLKETYQLWEKMVTDNAIIKNRSHKEIKIPAKRVIKFKAGNELATKVK